ncbi:hypothetical protein IKG68_00345 [Candidatus Saccharibacteria bacterium]|nr:hypothetical protein [Candidatus Saccharibacteria bacterium]
MSDKEVLRFTDDNAMRGEIVSHVMGKNTAKKVGKKWGSITAGGFIAIILVIVALVMLGGNLMPAAISERIIEETDVQYADAVESKLLVLQQALYTGDIPENTKKRLVENGVELVENNGGYSILYNGKVVAAKDFIAATHSDAGLYAAINNATYGRAGYWYDETATKLLREIGTGRNNYTEDADFDEVMNKLMGSGNEINVENVAKVERETDDGGTEIVYEGTGTVKSSVAADFVNGVAGKSLASNSTAATLNAGDILNKSDIMAKEQKSAIFFLGFMENISKMKAGDGGESRINEAMNLLYSESENEVVDVATGEVVRVKGSMMEAPSLYAILSGEKIDTVAVQNYASDRVLRTVENLSKDTATAEILNGTVASTTGAKLKGTVGRLIDGSDSASSEILNKVVPTINTSLINNTFEDVRGVAGGELLVEGAVNVGKLLARASGGTTGDAAAVKAYARVTDTVLALDKEVDRMSRSPFDVSSPNTFLGTLVRKMGAVLKNGLGILGKTVSAEDNENLYLTNFGDCKTLGNIGAVGTAGCSSIMTFDTSTLNDTFNDAGFVSFVEENTILVNGTREVKPGSALAKYIEYNSKRKTTDGVMDGGILDSISNNSSLLFISNITSAIQKYVGATESDKRIANGAAFVDSAANLDWNTYKYAQRYMALARATETLRQFDGDKTAYNNIPGLEGGLSPVIAYEQKYLSDSAKIATK